MSEPTSLTISPNKQIVPTTVLSTDMCRDYINGKCNRTYCKYKHVNISQSQQNQETANNLLITNPPHNIFNKFYVPTKAHVFLNINNFIAQEYYNGMFICNMADIIPISIIEKLLDFGKPNSMTQINANKYITSLSQDWITKLKTVINWTNSTTDRFDRTNYSTIFVYDICQVLNNLIILKGWSKKKNNVIADNLLWYLNILFTHIFNELQISNINGLNIIVNYCNDELTLNNKYILEMLYEVIYSGQNKYISPNFFANMFYIGLPPNLIENIGNESNKGFVFCSISGVKYINLLNIYSASISVNGDTMINSVINNNADIDICSQLSIYNKELYKHNAQIYDMLFTQNEILKKKFYDILASAHTNMRPDSLVIIGCNLDADFDKQILSGLKLTLGSIDFDELVINSKEHGKLADVKQPGKLPIKNLPNDNDDCCNMSNTPSPTVSLVIPIFTTNDTSSQNKPNNNMVLNPHNINSLKDIFTNQISNGITVAPKNRLIQNMICTINLGLVKTHNGDISVNQPFDMIQGIEKIKEYGLKPNNKIIIVCSALMTHKYFTDFINQITCTPGYPNKISSQFIDFNINPSIRSCLAYHNYRTINKINLHANLGNEIPIVKMTKLWYKLNSYISVVKSGYNTRSHENTIIDNADKCCKCCSCLSRNGVIYTKYGNIPFIPLDILSTINDDSWLPRL